VKRLLAISWEMPPLSGPRAVQVTRTLAALGELGWRSRVICFQPQSDRYQQDYRVSLEELSHGTALRVPVPSPEEWFLIRALWRLLPPLKHSPDEKIVWMPPALAEARRVLAEEPADVIVSFAQPWTDHLIGLRLHEDTGIPWVAHFSDPWTDSPYQPFAEWFSKRRSRLEADVIRQADATVFVNDQTRQRVMKKYPEALRRRAHVVPQGFVAASPLEIDVDGPLRVVYTGRFYDGVRTPHSLLAAVDALNRERPLAGKLDIEFVGSGMDAYAHRAERMGLRDIIRFTGRRSPDEARVAAAGADVLLLIDAASNGPSLFLPSKLIDYLPLRRPILGITPPEGPSADLLREFGYPIVAPDDEPRLKRELAALLDAKATGRLAASANHDAVASAYSITNASRQFDQVLRSVIEVSR
jgi:glycosyltransferase involved in cell wall biosynthesis